jgi:two-component system NtrC family sensor kinase
MAMDAENPTSWKVGGGGCAHRRLLRWAAVLAALVAFCACFPWGVRVVGESFAAFSLVPTVTAGLLLGQTPAFLVGLAHLPLNMLLFRFYATSGLAGLSQHLPPTVVVALAGGLVGRLRDMGRALQGALQRESAARLAQEEQQIQLALAQEVASIGSWVWDVARDEHAWSPQFYRIFGLAMGEACPSCELALACVHPDDRASVRAAFETALRERRAFECEHRVVHHGGEVRFVHARGQLFLDRGGSPTKMIGTAQDVTEHKALQDDLVVARRLAGLGTLARGVAHEINNPLAYVLSSLSFATNELEGLAGEEPGEALAEVVAALKEARAGADQVRYIVNDLQAFSSGRDRLAAVDPERALDLAINIAASQIRYRARLVKDYADVPPVEANEARLGQVFLNLLLNAAQAIPEGRVAENEIRVVTRREGADRVAVEIRDTGCGIPPEIRDRVFDPFFTTKQVGRGTGLGLYICHGIVKAMSGEITLQSEVGRGTTFRILLPVAGAARGEPAGSPSDGPVTPRAAG